MNKQLIRSVNVAALLVLGVASGCAASVEDWDEDLGAVQEEIINGQTMSSNSNMVAIYGKTTSSCSPDAGDQARGFTQSYTLTNAWWPRPCSGTVIRKNGNDNYILTARHCITLEGTPEGTPLTGSTNLRSISTLNPGVLSTVESNGSMTVTGTPPSAALNTSVYYSNYATYGDIAIVKATGNLQPTTAAVRPGFMGFSSTHTSNFLNTGLQAQGYGRNLNGYCYSHQISGAGRLRYGSPFNVQSVGTSTFTHVTVNANQQQVWGGDSGGPLYTTFNNGGQLLLTLFGVNKTTSTATGGQNIADFMQTAFGYIYLVKRSALNGTTVVGVTSAANGQSVRTNQSGGLTTQRITIDRANGYLKIGGLCFNDEFPSAGTTTVRLRSCGGATTKWDIFPGGAFKNRSSNRYLLDDGSGLLKTEPTPPFPTAFAFTADDSFS